jgi:Ser/Thr protein kinase RdoA (MazF antagonist)
VLELLQQNARAFKRFGGYALTHPDVEPGNVAMSDAGPVLMDWDFAGPDSCPLVLAHAALNFALVDGQPDPTRIQRTVRAYREAGGAPLSDGSGLLTRRLGMLLSRLSERLRASIGEEDSLDPGQARFLAVKRLRDLPAFSASLSRWEELFPRD